MSNNKSPTLYKKNQIDARHEIINQKPIQTINKQIFMNNMKTTMKKHWIKIYLFIYLFIIIFLWVVKEPLKNHYDKTKLERSLNHQSRNQKLWWIKNQKSFMNRMRAIMKNYWVRNQEKSMSHNSKTKYHYDKSFGKIYEPQKIFHLIWTAKTTMWTRNVKQEDWLNEAKHGVKEQETWENWQHEWRNVANKRCHL